MPYTQQQIRALSAMGIVPWVDRTKIPTPSLVSEPSENPALQTVVETVLREERMADVAASAQPAASVKSRVSTPAELMQIPLVEIPFRGQICTQLGKADAPLLILVEAISNQQKQYPFEATDAKLFDDMLRAINWRRQDVCLAVLPPTHQTDLAPVENGPCVADVCKPHRDAVLLFRHSVPLSLNADELLVPMERESMPAWQLPHPALLRESPDRKRQAWNVLKAARARLQ